MNIDRAPTSMHGFDVSATWKPTVAYVRSAVGALVLIACALIWRRPDLLVIATPCAVVTAWSMLTRPSSSPRTTDGLGHSTIREGDATTWRGTIDGDDAIDLAVAVFPAAPWTDTHPSSGCTVRAARAGRADLDLEVRSTRWGRRPIDGTLLVASSSWGAFRWATVGERHMLTTLPLPAVFDVNASARPSDGLIGLHRSVRPGEGNEFSGIRQFQAGDRMRRINWSRSVRSGELQVNSTLGDLDTHVALVLDAIDDVGISEGIGGRASSLDQTVRAAGAIAEQYALRGERVSLRTFGARLPHTLAPLSGRGQLRRILDTLAQVRPGDTSRLTRRLSNTRYAGAHVTVMLSPLIAPEALDLAVSLGRGGTSVVIVDTLPDDIVDDDDRYTALAWRIRLLERRQEIRAVQAAGIPVVTWRGPGSLDQVLRDIAHRAAAPRMVLR